MDPEQTAPKGKKETTFVSIGALRVNSLSPRLMLSADNLQANSLDPNQAQQNFKPDRDPISLTSRWYS